MAETNPQEPPVESAPADPKTGKPAGVKWDKPAQDPNKRKSVAEDPDGRANARAFNKK